MKFEMNKKAVGLNSLGLLLVTFGVYLGWVAIPGILESTLNEERALTEGSKAFESWQKITVPVEFKVRIFNVTNPDEASRGEVPLLKELGPYVYSVTKERVNVKHNHDSTITYKDRTRFKFNKEASGNHSDEDWVTAFNMPIYSGAMRMAEKSKAMLDVLNKSIPILFPAEKAIFMRMKVKTLLFDGILINCTDPRLLLLCSQMKDTSSAFLFPDKNTKNYYRSSFFGHENSSDVGPYRIENGRYNVSDVGRILKFRKKTKLVKNTLKESCNEVKGTDGFIFPPHIDQSQPLHIFSPLFCGSIALRFDKYSEYNGFQVSRFVPSEENYGDPNIYPNALCRCTKKPNNEGIDCPKEGIIDATSCLGVPFILSKPYLSGAHEEYKKFIPNNQPDDKDYDSNLLIDTFSGVPMLGSIKLQINIFMKKVKEVDMLANVTEGLLPVLWIEQGAEIEESALNDYRKLMNYVLTLDIVKWTIIGAGIVCEILAVIMFFKTLLYRNSGKVNITNEVKNEIAMTNG